MMATTSLLIPCYNAASFLPRLWRDVRAQEIPFSEVICYDDGSSDNTTDVARSLGATVIRCDTNRGPSHARNQLWRAARGTWVHFHDADDLMAPSYHAKVAAHANDTTDVVICGALWQREDTRQTEMEWKYTDAELRNDPVSYLLTHPVGGINGYYRRSALEKINGYDERLRIWEDADLHLRLALAGARFAVVEESLVIALRRHGSASAELRSNWRNRLSALHHYADSLPLTARTALLSEIDQTARQLIRLGEIKAAREAIALSHRLGGTPPHTHSRILQLCRRLAGSLTAFRLQLLLRRT